MSENRDFIEMDLERVEVAANADPVVVHAKKVMELLNPGMKWKVGQNVFDELSQPLTERKFNFLSSIYHPDANEVQELRGAMIRGLHEFGVKTASPDHALAQLATAYRQMLEIKAGKRDLPVELPKLAWQLEKEDGKVDLDKKEETLPGRDELIEKTGNRAFELAVEAFEANGLYDEGRHGHLVRVAEGQKIIPISPETMTSLFMEKYGATQQEAEAQRAFYVGTYGDSQIDAVFVRNDLPLDLEMTTHEFVHRAAFLGAKALGEEQIDYQIFNLLGYPLEKRRQLKQGTGESSALELQEVYELRRVLVEGLTQWSTRELGRMPSEKGQQELFVDDPSVYQFEVAAVDFMQKSLEEFYSVSTEKARALILDAALAGDLSVLRQVVGAGLPSLLALMYDCYQKDIIEKMIEMGELQ